ncbi:MAG: hypothetical protein ACUVXA_06520 [Candidatus Jordarchaeum sp.]|uniref:hypothetical protein n=1 Tax=Candidatus Jordarchaeum sp. TaxID=2823881 RepID=UPI004049E174
MEFGKRVIVASVLLGVSLYILLPSPEEIIIHPALGLLLSQVFVLPYFSGIILSVTIYRVVGVGCLLFALLLGGGPIYQKLKTRFKGTEIEEPVT